MASKLDDVATILKGPVGWVVVGGVVLLVGYVLIKKGSAALGNLGTSILNGIEAPFIAGGQAIYDGAQNTAAPISTQGGTYTGADGSTTSDDGTDALTLLAYGGLGA